jgi:hypothetical protein
MITKKDQDVLNFLTDFHIGTCNQIHKLFYNLTSIQYTRKRLKYLYDNDYIKRARSTIDNSYAYYIDRKPVQLHHDLIRAELYANIKSRYDLLEWTNEAPVSNIRPDALAYVKHVGIVFPLMIEIHLSNGFNFDKYKIDFKPIFGTNPRVIICTDREVKPPVYAVKFKIVGLDMSNLDSLLK